MRRGGDALCLMIRSKAFVSHIRIESKGWKTTKNKLALQASSCTAAADPLYRAVSISSQRVSNIWKGA